MAALILSAAVQRAACRPACWCWRAVGHAAHQRRGALILVGGQHALAALQEAGNSSSPRPSWNRGAPAKIDGADRAASPCSSSRPGRPRGTARTGRRTSRRGRRCRRGLKMLPPAARRRRRAQPLVMEPSIWSSEPDSDVMPGVAVVALCRADRCPGRARSGSGWCRRSTTSSSAP